MWPSPLLPVLSPPLHVEVSSILLLKPLLLRSDTRLRSLEVAINVVGADAVVEEVAAGIVRDVAVSVGIAVVAVVGRLRDDRKKGVVAVVTRVARILCLRRLCCWAGVLLLCLRG
jgi:hypothetical protein